ncbi:MAG: hypothetical protein H0U08_07010 [Actinobacteria bacterium]|nr:hypothetical protein [Actinomycetota bacterium]
MNDYGITLAELPARAFDDALVVPVDGHSRRWAIDLDLWSAEGRSDLTLQITAWIDGEFARLAIEDIHVL